LVNGHFDFLLKSLAKIIIATYLAATLIFRRSNRNRRSRPTVRNRFLRRAPDAKPFYYFTSPTSKVNRGRRLFRTLSLSFIFLFRLFSAIFCVALAVVPAKRRR